MSERKLRAGYVRANITAQASIIICVESGAWWLWNLAPAECFEGGEPMRPLGDDEFVAEAEKPKPDKNQRLIELLRRVYDLGEMLGDAENAEMQYLIKEIPEGQVMLDEAFAKASRSTVRTMK